MIQHSSDDKSLNELFAYRRQTNNHTTPHLEQKLFNLAKGGFIRRD
jgi:hypothetical protein